MPSSIYNEVDRFTKERHSTTIGKKIAVYLTRFVLNGISCLILLLPIISRVFNQLILVKLFVL